MKTNILPDDVIAMVRAEGEGFDFGVIRLEIHLRDGKPRWDIGRSRSILEDTIRKGIDLDCPTENKQGAAK